MEVVGGGFGERGMMGLEVRLGVGRRLDVCWLERGVGMEMAREVWVKVRLLVFREEGWDGRLMLVLVLAVEEKEEKMGSGGLGLDGNVVAVVGEPHDWLQRSSWPTWPSYCYQCSGRESVLFLAFLQTIMKPSSKWQRGYLC